MRARTSVILCIAGAVLTFAVSGHPAVVDVQLVGVILMLTGVAGRWPPGGRTWLLLGRSRLRRLVDEVAPVQGARVPLEALLATGQRPQPATRHVWAAQAGHQQHTRVPGRAPEVTRDGEASERATTD